MGQVGTRKGIASVATALALAFAVTSASAFSSQSRSGKAGTRPTSSRGGASPYAGRIGLGVDDHLFNSSVTEIQGEFARIRSGGVSWIREDFSWNVIEPRRGSFNWAPFDRLMEAASRTGMHVLGILDYSAPWASSDPLGRGNPFYPPKDDSDFARYSAAVASRYGSTGEYWKRHPSERKVPLGAVEIWNEPFIYQWWNPAPDPAAYAKMVRSTAPAVRSADPRIRILMSGDLDSLDQFGHYTPWIARLLSKSPGIARLVDGVSVHPYPEPWDLGPYDDGWSIRRSFGRVPLIRQAELAAGIRLPIWITEIGWSTAPDTPHAVSEETQARFLREAVHRSIEDWGAYVPKVFLFAWRRSNGVQGDRSHNYGLLDARGKPKQSWTAIKRLIRSGG
jgi:polysaccharide biosynthesis protein PslG